MDDPNVQQKIGVLKAEANEAFADALTFVKLPNFQDIINTARRQRKRFFNYEQTSGRHL